MEEELRYRDMLKMNQGDTLFEWDEKTFAKFAYLQDVRISNNGEQVAYVLTKANLEDDEYKKTIVIENLENGERKYIQDASAARFAPNGTKLTFVRANDEKETKQLMLVDLRTMSAKKLLETKNIFDVRWNQDNRRLLITSSERLEDEDVYFDDKLPIWFNERGFLAKETGILQIFDTDGEEIIDKIQVDSFVLPYVSNLPMGIWHGNAVIYNVPRRENPYKLFDIYKYEHDEQEKLFEGVSFKALDSNGEVALLHGKPEKEKLTEHDYLYVWDGEQVTSLTKRYVYNNSIGKLDKEGNLYFTTYEEGKITLEALKDDEKTSIVDENAWVTGFDVSDNGRIAFLMQKDTQLSEVYLWDTQVTKITDYNAPIIEKLGVQRLHHFSFESLDLELDGWYMKPNVQEDRKAPVVVFVHGGPKGMYGYYFRYEMQLLASKGFYSVFVNPRGSNGYDEDFASRVLKRTGREDFQDIIHGVGHFLENEAQADENRVGITGISYGGFMTNWAVTQTDLFKAAVSENGISYWLTSYAFSDIGLWFDEELIGESPLENENYRELSPLFHVQNVTTPLLIIHSRQDYRCPLDQSVMFYHMLKKRGKEAYIAVFKKGAHGHSRQGSPNHRAKRYKLFTNFFERKLVEEKEGFPAEELLGQSKQN